MYVWLGFGRAGDLPALPAASRRTKTGPFDADRKRFPQETGAVWNVGTG
jgi:hypothetical protein